MNEKGPDAHRWRRLLQIWGGIPAGPRGEDTMAFGGAAGRPEIGIWDAAREVADTSWGRKSLDVTLSDMEGSRGLRQKANKV